MTGDEDDWKPNPYDLIEDYARATQKGLDIVRDDFERAFDTMIGAERCRPRPEFG